MNHTCKHCGSADVHLLMPAWVDANTLALRQVDDGAEPLATFCNECHEERPLNLTDRDGTTHTIIGRWSA